MSRQRRFSGGLKSVATRFSLSRQKWLLGCRDKVVGVATGKWYDGIESCRDKNSSVATELAICCRYLGSWVTTEPSELDGVVTGRTPSEQRQSAQCGHSVQLCPRQRAQHARERVHYAHDLPMTVYSIVHCLGHCSWTLFTNIFHGHCLKKKKSTKLTPGIWGATKSPKYYSDQTQNFNQIIKIFFRSNTKTT